MKLAQTRIVTRDVAALTRFYMALTGMTPTGNDRYIELRAPGLALAISSQRVLDQHSAQRRAADLVAALESAHSRRPVSEEA